MSFVFVVDAAHRPLEPSHPGRARYLLDSGQAAVLYRAPFTIILKEAKPAADPIPLRLKIDPGSATTGIAVVKDATGQVVAAAELTHRGHQITAARDQRRNSRRSRRQRHTRYRRARYQNRVRTEGWLAPSLASRVQNVVTWVQPLQRLCPIGAISLELVKFDTHLMQNAEINGVEYQHGELAGYEVREYLLEKWGRRCAYCGATNVPLQIEHLIPKSRQGSDRVSNLTLACAPCNTAKGTQTAAEFGHPAVQAHAKHPLRDAAAVNSTRWALYRRLQVNGLPLETSTGGRTKWNRTQRGLPKTHWLDAACVGASTPTTLTIRGIVPLQIMAQGRHSRQMVRMDKYGFPVGKPKGPRSVYGFQTGELVRAVVTAGKKIGTYVGRVAIKSAGNFKVTGAFGRVEGISYRYTFGDASGNRVDPERILATT